MLKSKNKIHGHFGKGNPDPLTRFLYYYDRLTKQSTSYHDLGIFVFERDGGG